MKPYHSSIRSVTILTLTLVLWVGIVSKVQADEMARFRELAASAQKASGGDQAKLWKEFLLESSAFALLIERITAIAAEGRLARTVDEAPILYGHLQTQPLCYM